MYSSRGENNGPIIGAVVNYSHLRIFMEPNYESRSRQTKFKLTYAAPTALEVLKEAIRQEEKRMWHLTPYKILKKETVTTTNDM